MRERRVVIDNSVRVMMKAVFGRTIWSDLMDWHVEVVLVAVVFGATAGSDRAVMPPTVGSAR